MKTFTVKRSSWHYQLSRLSTRQVDNFCDYVKAVMTGAFWASIFTVIAIGITMAIGDFLAWLTVCIFNMQYIYPNVGAAVVSVGIFAVFCLVCFYVIAYVLKTTANTIRDKNEQEPGFVYTAWNSMKDRFCIMVDFRD